MTFQAKFDCQTLLIVNRAMEILFKSIFSLVLMCGCLLKTKALRFDEPEDDEMLDKMATDFVLDAIHAIAAFAELKDKIEGLPEVDGFHTRLKVAGLNFEIEAERGTFLGFPSLQTSGDTVLNHYFYTDVRYLSLETPIIFENFVIYYDNVTLKAEDKSWSGKILMTVKKNEFRPIFTIQHLKPKENCNITMGQVKTFSYTDADFDVKIPGLPEIHLKDISNIINGNSEYAHDYADLLVRRVFDHYLSKTSRTGQNPLRYCTYHTGLASIDEMMGLQKKFNDEYQHKKPLYLRSFIPSEKNDY